MLVVSCSAFVFVFVSWLGSHRHFDKENILVHPITINSSEQNSVMYELLC